MMRRPLQFVGPPMDDNGEELSSFNNMDDDDPDFYETTEMEDDEASECCCDDTNNDNMVGVPPFLVGVDSLESPSGGMSSSSSVDEDSESDIISLVGGDHLVYLTDVEDDDTFSSELNNAASPDDAQHDLLSTELDDSMEQQHSSADVVQDNEAYYLGEPCCRPVDPDNRTRQESSSQEIQDDDRAQQVVLLSRNDDSTAAEIIPRWARSSSSTTRIWQSDLLRYNNYLKKNHAAEATTMPERQLPHVPEEECPDAKPFQKEKTSKEFAELVHDSNSNGDDLLLGGDVNKNVSIDGQGLFCLPADDEVLPDHHITKQACFISDDTMSAAPDDDMKCRVVAAGLLDNESFANELCSTLRLVSCGDTIAPMEAIACGDGIVVSSERLLSDCDQNHHITQNMPWCDIGLCNDDKIGRDHNNTDQKLDSVNGRVVVLEDSDLSNGDVSGSLMERPDSSYESPGHEARLESLTQVHDGMERPVVSSVVSMRCSDTEDADTFHCCAAENEVEEIPVDQQGYVEPRLEAVEECVACEQVLKMADDSAPCPTGNEESTKVVVAMFEVADVGTSEDALPIGDVVADIEEWPFDDPCSTGDPKKICRAASNPVQDDVVERTEVVDDVSGCFCPYSEESSKVAEPSDDYGEMGTSEDGLCVEETSTASSGRTEFGGMWPHEHLAEHDDNGLETQPHQERASALELIAEETQGDIVDRVLAVADDLVRTPDNKETPTTIITLDELGEAGTTEEGGSLEETLTAGFESKLCGVELHESLYDDSKSGADIAFALSPSVLAIATQSIGKSREEFKFDDSSDLSTARPADVLLAAAEDVPTRKPCSDADHDESRLDSAKDAEQGTVGMYAEDHYVENMSVRVIASSINEERQSESCPDVEGCSEDATAPDHAMNPDDHQVNAQNDRCREADASKPVVDDDDDDGDVVPDYQDATLLEAREEIQCGTVVQLLVLNDHSLDRDYVDSPESTKPLCVTGVTNDSIARQEEERIKVPSAAYKATEPAASGVEAKMPLVVNTVSYSEPQVTARESFESVINLNNDKNDVAIDDGVDRPSETVTDRSDDAPVALLEVETFVDLHCGTEKQDTTRHVMGEVAAFADDLRIEDCGTLEETESKEQSNACDESVGYLPVDGDDDESPIDELCRLDDQAGAYYEYVASAEHILGILPVDDVELETTIDQRFCTCDQADTNDTNNVEDVNPVNIRLGASEVNDDCVVEHVLAVKDDSVRDANNMIPPDEVPPFDERLKSLSKESELCVISSVVECSVETIRAQASTDNAPCSQATEHLHHSEHVILKARVAASDHALVTLLQQHLPSTPLISVDCPKESASSCEEKLINETEYSAHQLTEAQDFIVTESHIDELCRNGVQAKTPQEALEEMHGQTHRAGSALQTCAFNVDSVDDPDNVKIPEVVNVDFEIGIRVIGAGYQYKQHAATAVKTAGTPDELHVALVLTLRRIPGCGVPENLSREGGAPGSKEEHDEFRETSTVLETFQNAPDSFWSPSSAIEDNESRSEALEVDVQEGVIAAFHEINALSSDPLDQVHPLGTNKTDSSCTEEATDASKVQKLEFEKASENCSCDTDKRDYFVHPPDGQKSLDVVCDDPYESDEESALACISVEKSSVREIPSDEALEVKASLEIPGTRDDDLLVVGDVEGRALVDGICFANDRYHDSSYFDDPGCAADIVKFPTISEVDHVETANLTLDSGDDASCSGDDSCYADHHDKSHQDAREAILGHVFGQPLAPIDGSSCPVNNVSKELTERSYEVDDDVSAAREIRIETPQDVHGSVDMREPTCTSTCDIAEGRYDPEVRTEAFCVSPVHATFQSLLEAETIRELAAHVGQDLTLDMARPKTEDPVYSFETKEELCQIDSEIDQHNDNFSPFSADQLNKVSAEKVLVAVPCAANGNSETPEERSTAIYDDVVEHNIFPCGGIDAEVVKLAALLTKVVRVASSEDQECQIGQAVDGVYSSEQSSTEDSHVSLDDDIQEKLHVNEKCGTNDTDGRVEEALSVSANLISIESNKASEIDVNIAPRSEDETCTSLESAEKFVCSTDSPVSLFKHFESVSAKGVDTVRVFEPVVYSLIKESRDVPVIDQCCVEHLKQDVSDFSAEHPNSVPVDVEEKPLDDQALGDQAPSDCGDDFAVLHDNGDVLRQSDASTNKGDEDRPSTSRYVLQEDLAGYAWNSGLWQPLNEQDGELPHAIANDFPVGMALSDEEHVARQSIAETIKQTQVLLGSCRNPVVPTAHTNFEEWTKKELSEQDGFVLQDDSVQQPDHLMSPSIASTGSVGESLVDEEGSSSAPSEDIVHDIADHLAARNDSVRSIDDFGLPEMPEPLGSHNAANDIASGDNNAATMFETTDTHNPAAISCKDEGRVDKSFVSSDSDHNVRPSRVNPVVVTEERTVVLADLSCDNADEIALCTTLQESSAGKDDTASAKAVREFVGHILGATDQYSRQTFEQEKLDDNTEAQAELNSEKPALSSERATYVAVGDDDTRQGTTNELQKDSINAPPPRDVVEYLVAVAPLNKVYNETGLSSEHCDAEKISSALGPSLDSVGPAVSLHEQDESAASKESANTSSTTGGIVGHHDFEARLEAPLVASERADDFVDRARRVPSNHTPRKFGLLNMFRRILAGSDEDHVVQGKEQENVVLVNDSVGSGQQQCGAAIANETTSTGCILARTIAGEDLAGGSVSPFVASPLEETDEEESITFSFSDYSIAPKPLQSSGFESDALWI